MGPNPKALKITLFALGGLVGVLALAALAVLILVDANSWKPRAETAPSAMMKMHVTVEGPMSIAFVPGLASRISEACKRRMGV